jgi:hypothetical protein
MDSKPTESSECLKFPSYYDFIKTPFMVVGNCIDTTVHGPCAPQLDEQESFWDNYRQEVHALALRYIEVRCEESTLSFTFIPYFSEFNFPVKLSTSHLNYTPICLGGDGCSCCKWPRISAVQEYHLQLVDRRWSIPSNGLTTFI